MNTKQLFTAFTVLILLLIIPLQAMAAAGGAVPVLRFGVGARAFAMGGAYIAIVEDPTAVYWNPAGLSVLTAPEFSGMHSELFAGTRYDYLGWAMPLGSGGLGINYLSLSTPGIINTEGGGTEASTRVAYAGYGWKARSWRLGATVKYIWEDILGSMGNGWSMDIGVQTKIGEAWRLGLVVQDLTGSGIDWDTGFSEEIPANYRLGLAYTHEKWLLVFEGERAGDFGESHFGLEYAINDFLQLRAGARGEQFTAGIGLASGNWAFDYAYCAADLGNTHRLSFSVKL
jgi:hypothetical protein